MAPAPKGPVCLLPTNQGQLSLAAGDGANGIPLMHALLENQLASPCRPSTVGQVPELQPLRADHASAVLAFELVNRDYFAASISDRGDEFFDKFTERHNTLLTEQEAGMGAYYLLVDEEGSVLGRFNLFFTGEGTANLGYRVAQHVSGHGVATATVRELCRLAVDRHGLRTLKAATSGTNIASQKVLTKSGFIPVAPADPADLGGKSGTWYQRDLTPED
jgi:RimJ/RimL family protein N-acetyltransferase